MGDRVTWRSRPRWDGKYRAGYSGSLAGYSGPFTHAQIVEIMWRVKSIRLAATLVYSGGSESFDHILTCRHRVTAAEITSEAGLMAGIEGGSISFVFLDTSAGFGEGRFMVNSFTSVSLDGSNEYWLKGDSMIYGRNDYAADQVFSVQSGDNYELDVSTTLELSDGVAVSFALCMLAPDGSTGSCTMTVEEWWPYADKAGMAAWDSSTGMAVNGGPGG